MNNRQYKNGFELFGEGIEEFYNMVDGFLSEDLPKHLKINELDFKIDVISKEESFVVLAEMPGFEKEEIDIVLEEGKLTLSAEHEEVIVEDEEDIEKVDEKNYVLRERKSTRLERSLYFENIDEENISATLEKGILTVTIPKKITKEKKKKIEIV